MHLSECHIIDERLISISALVGELEKEAWRLGWRRAERVSLQCAGGKGCKSVI